MHISLPEAGGGGADARNDTLNVPKSKQFVTESSSLPFGQSIALSSIEGSTYLTAQTLIQHVAYTLSDKLFTYSENFDLDAAAKNWSGQNASNAYGYTTQVSSMQTRQGAAAVVLGYIFSPDFDLKKRHIPQSILASSASLNHLRTSLDQLALLYNVASPFVAHVAAATYRAGTSKTLQADYATAFSIAEELGYGLVASRSTYESQHMALFATLLAQIVPTIHIYDGVTIGRDTTRVSDVLGQSALFNAYMAILAKMDVLGKKNTGVEGRVAGLIRALNSELGTAYGLFEYTGHPEAEDILVVFGTADSSVSSQVASTLAKKGDAVGVVTVRVYWPFVEEEFLKAIPVTAKRVMVLGQVRSQLIVQDDTEYSKLFAHVLATISFSARWPKLPTVSEIKYWTVQFWDPQVIVDVFAHMSSRPIKVSTNVGDTEDEIQLLETSTVKQYTFWDSDDSASVYAPRVLGKLLAKDSKRNVTISSAYDNLVQGGVVKTDIRDSKQSIEAAYPIRDADVAYIGNEDLLTVVDVAKTVKKHGTIILRFPGRKDDDIEKKLPIGFRKTIADRSINLIILDTLISPMAEVNPDMEGFLTQLAFLNIACPDLYASGLGKLAEINGNIDTLNGLSKDVERGIRRIEIPESWSIVDPEVDIPSLPTNIDINSFESFDKEQLEPPCMSKNWKSAAKGLVFKEAYGTHSSLRPDLTVKTFPVKVKENRRLTPLAYDRNIFHIEFDLGDSGLKYDIGEALGIHAENNTDEVEAFIKFYGLVPEEIVEIPSREDPDVLEARTVWQALVQNIDIFGRPPKKFYEALADFADDNDEKKNLLSLSGLEGINEFKRRAEVDTTTFADVLLEFPSAHPSFYDIVKIVNPMKRREYSIASSQKVTPTSVSLLVVTVGWVDPKGRNRWGQATRYLDGLRIGDPVTVSVKPSVMKLPPKSTQPLIMAGLGTGLAPFRAFVQYRAWQKEQGEDIGSVLLYMGSRHQREEYLYGEEWEAYQDAGVITLLGRAFSRDQPQKIYIQDRMRQTMGDIIDAYIKEDGVFYLCGPTWPVPDVTQVLEEAISKESQTKGKKINSATEIQRLKEDGRYVLEGETLLYLDSCKDHANLEA
jgi:sulfite reductase (NADPH) flavoprotein alpha-component